VPDELADGDFSEIQEGARKMVRPEKNEGRFNE
jgi:hypothetical protein